MLGGLLGYVLGGDNKKRNVAIGAVLGGVAGYAIGNEVARRKAQYASDEAFLDAEIRQATEFNRTAAQYNEQLRTDIAALDQTSRDLEERHRAGLASKQQLADQSAEVKHKLAETQNVYDTLKKEYDVKVAVYQDQQQTRRPDDAYLALLQQEIRQLENNLEQLRSESIQLAQIDERLAR